MHNLFHPHSAAKDQSKAMRPVHLTRVVDDHSRKLYSNLICLSKFLFPKYG